METLFDDYIMAIIFFVEKAKFGEIKDKRMRGWMESRGIP